MKKYVLNNFFSLICDIWKRWELPLFTHMTLGLCKELRYKILFVYNISFIIIKSYRMWDVESNVQEK